MHLSWAFRDRWDVNLKGRCFGWWSSLSKGLEEGPGWVCSLHLGKNHGVVPTCYLPLQSHSRSELLSGGKNDIARAGSSGRGCWLNTGCWQVRTPLIFPFPPNLFPTSSSPPFLLKEGLNLQEKCLQCVQWAAKRPSSCPYHHWHHHHLCTPQYTTTRLTITTGPTICPCVAHGDC